MLIDNIVSKNRKKIQMIIIIMSSLVSLLFFLFWVENVIYPFRFPSVSAISKKDLLFPFFRMLPIFIKKQMVIDLSTVTTLIPLITFVSITTNTFKIYKIGKTSNVTDNYHFPFWRNYKTVFVQLGLLGTIFAVSPLIKEYGVFAYKLFGLSLSVKLGYTFFALFLGSAVYFYAVALIGESVYFDAAKTAGNIAYTVALIIPPLYLLLYPVSLLADLAYYLLKSPWAAGFLQVLLGAIVAIAAQAIARGLFGIFRKKDRSERIAKLEEEGNAVLSRARKLFEDEKSKVLAKAIARAVTKYIAYKKVRGKETDDKNKNTVRKILGVSANILGAATESADTRSWLTLPNRIFLSRHYLEEGEYSFNLTVDYARGGREISPEEKFSIKQGEMKFIVLRQYY